MTVVAAAVLGVLIGAVLGGLGGGGAILTVPTLVYLLGERPQDATTASLVIVGGTAAFAVVGHTRSGQVHWPTGLAFGAAGILTALAGSAANQHVPPKVLLLAFAALMTLAAGGMLARTRRTATENAATGTPQPSAPPIGGQTGAAGTPGSPAAAPAPATGPRRWQPATVARVVLAGAGVGFLTGFLGVGGGFLIVPALVLTLALPMPAAVGTSLLVIAINSAASLAGRVGHVHFDWAVIVPFTLAAAVASAAGRRVAGLLPPAVTTRVFALLVLAVAAFTVVQTVT